jgi:hypothetical protein
MGPVQKSQSSSLDKVKGKAGRSLSYVATVWGNGILLIGKAYSALLDLSPRDEFEITLGRKVFRLMQVGGPDEEE